MPPPVHFPAVPDSVGLQPNNGATNIRATDGMAAATLINRFISSPYIHGKLLSFCNRVSLRPGRLRLCRCRARGRRSLIDPPLLFQLLQLVEQIALSGR